MTPPGKHHPDAKTQNKTGNRTSGIHDRIRPIKENSEPLSPQKKGAEKLKIFKLTLNKLKKRLKEAK